MLIIFLNKLIRPLTFLKASSKAGLKGSFYLTNVSSHQKDAADTILA
jgi:hypothetical protein